MELQKKGLPEKGLLRSLTAAIQSNGNFNLLAVNKLELATELKKYKTSSGGINYPAIFNIPVAERISELAKQDFTTTVQVLSVAITLSLESINLKRQVTSGQIFDLAEAIIDDSESDRLSLEDLLLFLQKLTRGEYGELYDSLDVPKFMIKFGQYRDERWEAGIKIRDEKVIQHKMLGDQEKTSQVNPLADHMVDFAGRIGDLKDQLREKNDQIRNMKGED